MYDLIIVGGGVAGGRISSQLDLDTLLIERDKKVELKDSGIVSKRFLDIFGKKLVEHKINIMKGISPSGQTFNLGSEEEPFAYLIDRIGFSKFLRKEARKKAKIKYEFAEKIEYGKNSVIVTTNKGIYEAKMVIGCDGTLSTVRKYAGITPPKMYPGLLVRTKKKIPGKNIQVFFNKFYSPEFFSWIIPQNNEYGLITGIRPREHLNYFKENLNLPEGKLYSYLIPLGATKSYRERTILVGDACGQSKPITGGGIVFSLRAARHAINIINRAFERKDFSEKFLKQYENEWRKEMLSEIKKQIMIRRIYRKMGNKDIEEFFTKLGPHIESLEKFDYDHFTDIWKILPKTKIASFVLPRLKYLF